METLKKLRILNSNTIKLIAAIAMFIDHLGLIFFPSVAWLRMVGRLAMPIFAFAIAEGCRYTKNKWKHFFLLFGLGAACQVVYYIFDPTNLYFGILITFSVSTLMIYAMQFAKKCTFEKDRNILLTIGAWLPFLALVAGTFVFCQHFTVDYRFWGCMLPVFASIFDFHRIPAPEELKKLDSLLLRVLCLGVGLGMLAISYAPVTLPVYAFPAILILLLYNGKKGKTKLKYFFYLFYPLHLVLLEGVYLLIA